MAVGSLGNFSAGSAEHTERWRRNLQGSTDGRAQVLAADAAMPGRLTSLVRRGSRLRCREVTIFRAGFGLARSPKKARVPSEVRGRCESTRHPADELADTIAADGHRRNIIAGVNVSVCIADPNVAGIPAWLPVVGG